MNIESNRSKRKKGVKMRGENKNIYLMENRTEDGKPKKWRTMSEGIAEAGAGAGAAALGARTPGAGA